MLKTIYLLLLLLVSCAQPDPSNEVSLKEKELELREKEIELKEREMRLENQSNSSTITDDKPLTVPLPQEQRPEKVYNKKFCYVLVETNEPELEYWPGNPSLGLERRYTTNSKYFTYTSKIIELENFSEDESFKLRDLFEMEVRDGFGMKDLQLKGHGQCEITSSKCLSFNTYKEASEHKRETR